MVLLDSTNRTKFLLILSFLLIFILLLFPISFGFSALIDESHLAVDIIKLYENGGFNQFQYPNGQAYLAFIAAALHLVGLDYPATNSLSPLITAFALTTCTVSLYVIYRDEWGGDIGTVGLLTAFFSFGGFVAILATTTHKPIVYTLVFVGVLLLWRYHQGSENRFLFLLLGLLSTISFINVLWGAIYATIFGVLLIIPPTNTDRTFRGIASLIPLMVSYLVIGYYEHVDFTILAILAKLRRLVGAEQTVGTTTTKASGFIGGWPTITMADRTFSLWFVYSSGIIFIGLLTAMALAISVYRIYKNESDVIIEWILVGILPLFGVLMVALAAAGDIPTLRRIIVVPGILGTLYWLGINSEDAQWRPSLNRQAMIVLLTVCLLCSGAILAIPKNSLDGHHTPYDFYAEDSDIQRASWINSFAEGECTSTEPGMDRRLNQRLFGENVDLNSESTVNNPTRRNQVYVSKSNTAIICPVTS